MADGAKFDRCFVIGPIGDQLAEPDSDARLAYEASIEVFENIIQAACNEFGIEAYRSDDIDKPGEITEQIFEALRTEPFVIADLTGANPNVMYELGMRHTLNKVTIQIGEKGRLPFDITTIRTVQFNRTRAGIIGGRKALAKAIGTTLAQGFDPPTATRVWSVGEIASGSGASSEALAADAPSEPEGDEGLGFVELLADMEDAIPQLGDQMASLTELTSDIGELASLHGEKLLAASSGGHKVAAIHRFATELDPLVKRFDQESVEAVAQARLIDGGLHYMYVRIRDDPDERNADSLGFLLAVSGMGSAAGQAKEEGLQGFYDSTESLLGASQKLRPVIRLLRSSLERLINLFSQVEQWGVEAAEILVLFPDLDELVGALDDPDEVALANAILDVTGHEQVKRAPAKKVPAKKASAKKASAKKVPAKKASAKKVPAKKVPAKKG